MHASFEQLSGLRDREPVTAEVAAHVRGCAQCSQALAALSELCAQLCGLPGFAVPAAAWQRIVTRFEQDPRRVRRMPWLRVTGAGAVAALAVALALFTWHAPPPRSTVPVAETGKALAAPSLPQLIAQSRFLENTVLSMNVAADHMVISAGTAATVAALEDRIALIDYAINQTATQAHAGNELPHLWQQRVELLQSLAAVRYAQVAGDGI